MTFSKENKKQKQFPLKINENAVFKNQKTVSLQGDPYVAFTVGTFIAGLGSLYLDSNSYLILPDHSEYDFGTDDFTIEFYVKFPTSTHIQWIFSFDGELGENDWRLGINSGGFLTFNQVGNGITSGSSIDFNGTNLQKVVQINIHKL